MKYFMEDLTKHSIDAHLLKLNWNLLGCFIMRSHEINLVNLTTDQEEILEGSLLKYLDNTNKQCTVNNKSEMNTNSDFVYLCPWEYVGN